MTVAPSQQRSDIRPTSVSRTAEDGDPSTTVVLAVAEALDTDPLDLSPALYEVIDPDALDSLFESAGADADLTCQFSGWGCTITVFDGGRVRVTPGR
ncbi:HalOD1 output domain-containing protein [Halostella litorea]|uniref:HalOD1 output domain-containing protein n=1 Tax=Halostella litorea TaxID=2528831 RepID=UPI001386E1EF|nr:HalOD1 output domain-containing protein [Halostella litorea]